MSLPKEMLVDVVNKTRDRPCNGTYGPWEPCQYHEHESDPEFYNIQVLMERGLGEELENGCLRREEKMEKPTA